MNKSAREMFEELGYELDERNTKEILYKMKWEISSTDWISFDIEHKCKKQNEVIDKINLKIADYLESNYSIYAENEIEIDLINEIDNLLKEALNEP